MKFIQTKNKGFTLIEIMVVVTIIGILAAILFVNFDDARQQSRDKVRMTTLKEMQLSLELYKAQYDRYPAGCSAGVFGGPGPATSGFSSCTNYVTGHTLGVTFVPDFISQLPTDPRFENDSNRGYYYQVDTNGTGYKLMAYDVAESILVISYEDDFARCPGPTGGGCPAAVPGTTYAVYGGSGADW